MKDSFLSRSVVFINFPVGPTWGYPLFIIRSAREETRIAGWRGRQGEERLDLLMTMPNTIHDRDSEQS